jgi:hypothetical protein
MNLGDGQAQIVEFSPALPNQGAFFFRTYQHGSCWFEGQQMVAALGIGQDGRKTILGIRQGVPRRCWHHLQNDPGWHADDAAQLLLPERMP